MAHADPQVTAAFRKQVEWCRALGSPFTAALLEQAAGSLERGGALAALVGRWPGDPIADALALRVAGAAHALVLEEADAVLSAAYPRPDREGRPEAAWRAVEALLARDPAGFAMRLESPPQTNETGRALGLFPGLLVLAARFGAPMELLELGASAGLNLSMESFAYETPAWSRAGASGVLIKGDWRGPPPPLDSQPVVTARAGCDQNPLDAGKVADRTRLRAYVWADQFERMARLQAAIELAAAGGVRPERADAADWIERRLGRGGAGRLTVVYHSVFWQYPPAETRARIESAIRGAGETATAAAPLAWLRFEPEMAGDGPKTKGRFWVTLTSWPEGGEETLAEADAHGRWVEWLA